MLLYLLFSFPNFPSLFLWRTCHCYYCCYKITKESVHSLYKVSIFISWLIREVSPHPGGFLAVQSMRMTLDIPPPKLASAQSPEKEELEEPWQTNTQMCRGRLRKQLTGHLGWRPFYTEKLFTSLAHKLMDIPI